MILVDTNVMSEPLRKVPAPGVAEWLDAQALETLYLSAITVAELRFSVRWLHCGDRAANAMMVATRDAAPFEAAGVKTVDPWTA